MTITLFSSLLLSFSITYSFSRKILSYNVTITFFSCFMLHFLILVGFPDMIQALMVWIRVMVMVSLWLGFPKMLVRDGALIKDRNLKIHHKKKWGLQKWPLPQSASSDIDPTFNMLRKVILKHEEECSHHND